MAIAKKDRILKLLEQRGVLRPRDLDSLGISRIYLNKLHAEGILDRPSRGIYTLPDGAPTENQTLIEASRRIPQATVCLLTALQFHGLTTQAPFEIWLAIDVKARLPKLDFPPVRIVRFSGDALTFGIQRHHLNGNDVKIFSPAKTVADCFKYRNKIGLDIAIEALRDCRQQKKATNDEIWTAAKICRMTNVMRPYMEAIA